MSLVSLIVTDFYYQRHRIIFSCSNFITNNHQNFLAKDLKNQFIGMNIKQKVKMKSITNEYRYFLKSNPFGVNKLFALAYSNEDDNSKRFQTKRF